MSLIEISHLNKKYGPKLALKDISLNLETGKIVGVLGPNGCGKTTLFKIIAGLCSHYTGEIKINNQPISISSKEMISYLPDKTYLNGWMKPQYVFDYFSDFYKDFDRKKAEELLSLFKLPKNLNISKMSKGMQEKLQITLVMSRQSKIYLLDEPLGGIDSATRSAILDVILRHYQENSLMILSTHLIYDVERVFEQVIFMDDGEIKLFDDVDNIRQKYNKSLDEVFKEVFTCSLNY